MTSVKVPVLVSRYTEDLYTSRVIDGPEADACGKTAAESYASVRDFLKKQGLKNPAQYWPRIDEYQLCDTTVRVRLFYRDGNRQFPASREMKLPVRYVLGHYVDRSVECFLVDFGIVFHCPAVRELTQLIEESVRGAAAQIDSRDLVAATPPRESELRIVRVRLTEPRDSLDEQHFESLTVVADPAVQRKRSQKSTPVMYRSVEVSKLISVMGEASVLLVGQAGCGKTGVAKLAASFRQLEARESAKKEDNPPPPPLVWQTSAENLIAGMQYLGEWEQRLEQVIAELESIGGILLVSSLIDLVRLGGTQPSDSLAAFLMPYVRRGEVRLIAEVTPDELDASRRLLPGWAECFQIIPIEPLSHEQTRKIAERMLDSAAKNYRIEVHGSTAETATRLFSQFMPYQSPPQGVVQLIGDVVRQKRDGNSLRQSGSEGEQGVSALRIGPSDMVDRFTRLTGLPETLLRDSVTLSSEDVRAELRQTVVGQEAAIESAARVVLRLKAGLCDSRRPVATMLFCGPTGVGKTQLARSLADYLFGHCDNQEKTLVRLDMSEYAGWDAVDRFLIADDGEVAPWVARLRARPMSVVLLDEFEKSSPEVHDCLLSALDEGRLTDRFGRTTTLCGAIMIMTSNVGSRNTDSIGFAGNDARALWRAVEHEFRPEFLNRLDEVVTFEPLPPPVIEQIVENELRALGKREALQSRRVRLHWDASVVKRIASAGFDPRLGARPLQRTIEREVVAKIARRLLSATNDQESLDIDLRELMTP